MKYKLTWYVGSVEGVNNSSFILKEKIIRKIKNVEPYLIGVNKILPKEVCKKICYVRYIHLKDDLITCDYGSYSRFVQIERVRY